MSSNIYQLMKQAQREGWAIGAFNAANIETLKAIFQAAQKLESPVIIETSAGETSYISARAMRHLVTDYADQHGVNAYLNLDHAEDLNSISQAINQGYELIHADGSRLNYRENVAFTKQVTQDAHRNGLIAEGELDHIVGSSDLHKSKIADIKEKTNFTDPDQAREFVKSTGIDTFAAFIGNVHGLYADPPELDFERLKRIHDSVDALLSLHGGSGIRDADVKKAISLGICKVNVNSELRLAFFEGTKKAVKQTTEIAPYKWLPIAIDEVQKVVEQKIKVFGSEGKAKKRWIKRVIV